MDGCVRNLNKYYDQCGNISSCCQGFDLTSTPTNPPPLPSLSLLCLSLVLCIYCPLFLPGISTYSTILSNAFPISLPVITTLLYSICPVYFLYCILHNILQSLPIHLVIRHSPLLYRFLFILKQGKRVFLDYLVS